MKSKFAATLVALALVLTGCGSAGDTSPSSSTPAESTLTEWVNSVGLLGAITSITDGLTGDLANLTSTDVAAANAAFTKRSAEILALGKAIAAESRSDDMVFEALRDAMVKALDGFGTKAGELASATDAERPAALLAATTAMTALTAAIQAVVDYISAHGKDTVHPAA